MRRKFLAVILSISMVLAMLVGMPSAKAVADGDSSVLRVRLSAGSIASLSFYTDGNYSVGDTVLERQLYTVKMEGGVLNLYNYTGKLISSGNAIYVTQRAATSGQNNLVWLNNELYGYTRYLGDLNFIISTKDIKGDTCSPYISAINCIDIEQYLWGVVPNEMSDSWPIEALKSQAVAARNYAMKRLGGGGSYDITDASAYDQVYKGYNPTATNARAAVDATAGQVLTYSGSIIDAYYSASNGGWTDLPYHRWGGGDTWPYYVITQDPYDIANTSSKYETIYMPAANLETAVGVNTAATSDNYPDTEPNAANAINYIKQCIVNSGQLSGVTSVNDFLLTGITAFGTTPPYDVTGSQDHSRVPANGVNDGDDCVDKTGAAGTFTVSVGGASSSVTVSNMDLNCLDGTNGTTYQAFFAPLGAFFIEPVMTDSVVTGYNLSQKRYGHGCGLSQRGAQQRANSGIGYADILGFYYPGTVLTTIHLTPPSLTAVTPAPDYSNATVSCSDSVNVRSTPDSSSSTNLVGKMSAGARIEVTDDFYTATWHQINYGGAAAYVHKDYVTLDSPMVIKRASGVTLDITTATISPGDTVTLAATVSPATAVNTAVTWTSDSAAATVSGGVVTAVSEGTARITATTADGGHQAVCTVTVKSNGITSVTYRIDTTTISGVKKNTSVSQFIAGLGNDAASLHVYKADGTELTTGNVGTGMTVALVQSGAEVDRLTIAIKGDVNGDGTISISDYTLVRYAILGYRTYQGAYLFAGDTSGDGKITISDYTLVRYDILGYRNIS